MKRIKSITKIILAGLVITLSAMYFSETVYADDPNVWGNSVTTAIYSGGFTDTDSGALVYLVDMDGYATKYTVFPLSPTFFS